MPVAANPISAFASRRSTGNADGGVAATRRAVARNRAAAARRRQAEPVRVKPTAPSRNIDATIAAVMPIEAAVLKGFIRAVESDVSAGLLMHDTRTRLIARAARLGIKRFDANLVIATVQHRTGKATSVGSEPIASLSFRQTLVNRSIVVATVLFTQAFIVTAAWYVATM